jgi:hypothetical protein
MAKIGAALKGGMEPDSNSTDKISSSKHISSNLASIEAGHRQTRSGGIDLSMKWVALLEVELQSLKSDLCPCLMDA